MRIFLSVLIFLVFLSTRSAYAEALVFNSDDFNPFVYTEDSSLAGPVTEILSLVCSRIKVECQTKKEKFGNSIDQMKNGEVDGLFLVSWSLKRTEWLYYTHPVLRTRWVFFVLADDRKDYRTLSSFKNFRVGVYGPSSSSRALERVNSVVNMDIQQTKDDLANLLKLINGQLDAVYVNRDVGMNLLNQKNLGSKVRVAWTHRERNYHIGFTKKKSRRLANQFNRALRMAHKSGEVKAILDKYDLESPM